MNYRTLGKTNLKVSEIGLGTEYLIGKPKETIVEVVSEAIKNGVNYIDLLYVTPEYRDGFGEAISGVRDKMVLAGHIGLAHIDNQYERTRDLTIVRELFDDLLKRLKTDYLDIVMLHYVDSDNLEELEEDSIYGFAKEMQRQGKVKFIGMSSHKVEPTKKAINSGKIDILMFPVNISRDGRKDIDELFDLVENKQIGLVAMKPFGGGKFLWCTENVTATKCLSYVLENKVISSVVPGVKDTNELKQSLEYITASEEEKDYSVLMQQFKSNQIEECLFCNHCLPCPVGINIGETISVLAIIKQYGITEEVKKSYNNLEVNPNACIECEQCHARCFLDIKVVSKLKELSAHFV